jgi:DNA topoisomerase-2
MAQDFVGSNNINLLLPNGQFGTRLQGGKDSASERYIFTKLNPITRYIFQKKDESILTYLDDDGQKVEPIFYVPIIPMVLINGTEGIGTGFSTKIPSFNPLDIIKYIKQYLEGKTDQKTDFIPYYKGFKGTVYRDDENPTRFITKGVYSIKKNKVEITELPIGLWNEDYIIYLEKLIDLGTIKDYKDMSTDKNVNIQVVLVNEENVEKTLKLTSYLSINNMNLFNQEEKLTHYNEIYEICNDFIKVRLEYYNLRKIYLIKLLENECELLKNKHAYISELLKGTIDLRKKTTIEITDILQHKKYVKVENTYNYLIKMTMDSVCEENVEHLQKEYNLKLKELDETIKLSIQNMWLNELIQLEKFI